MSSVTGYSPSTSIDYLAPNRYKVGNPLDRDGDGVADGKSLSGDSGKIVNEGEVNKILAKRGLKAVNGSFQSIDGFSLGSTNTSTVTDITGTPTIPDVAGPTAGVSSVGGALDWLSVTDGLNDAALMWASLSEMARTSMRDVKDAKTIKQAMQTGKIDAKKAEIKATAQRIDAEREEADRAFTFAVIGAVASAALGAVAGNQPGLQALAGQIGNVVQAFGNKLSHDSGPMAKKGEAELREKSQQMQQEIMQQAVDEADSNYQESKELMKMALKILQEHVERQSQVVQTVTRS